MNPLLLFFEGVLTFVSPCILPMLPLYVSYFAGNGSETEKSRQKVLMNTLLFTAGFSVIFLLLNLFVTTIGRFVFVNQRLLQIIAGIWLVLIGLDILLGNKWSSRLQRGQGGMNVKQMNSFMFGIVFAISWTPCVGTFLAAVLSQIATTQDYTQSTILMLAYCFGLSLPFILTALIMEEMQHSVQWLKRHVTTIHKISGILLMILGAAMVTGWFDYVVQLFNFS